MSERQLFRRLLRLLPFDFRADYGRDMEQVFREQHREAGGRLGARQRCGFAPSPISRPSALAST